jgi:hypothetical protein
MKKRLFCGFESITGNAIKGIISYENNDDFNKRIKNLKKALNLTGTVTMVDTPENREFWEGL